MRATPGGAGRFRLFLYLAPHPAADRAGDSGLARPSVDGLRARLAGGTVFFAIVGARRRLGAGRSPSSTCWSRSPCPRGRCRAWISPRAFRPTTAPWWSSPPCWAASEESPIFWKPWRSAISAIAIPTCSSPCSRISAMPPSSTQPGDDELGRPGAGRHRGAQRRPTARTARASSICFTGPGCGIRASGCGWARSASAASSSSSTRSAGGAVGADRGARGGLRVLRHRRRSVHPRVDQVRHHPRHRHATAPRRGAHAHRQHGSSAQSAGVRRREGPRRRGLRDPAAARLDQP